jgi:hypothetical protein
VGYVRTFDAVGVTRRRQLPSLGGLVAETGTGMWVLVDGSTGEVTLVDHAGIGDAA